MPRQGGSPRWVGERSPDSRILYLADGQTTAAESDLVSKARMQNRSLNQRTFDDRGAGKREPSLLDEDAQPQVSVSVGPAAALR